MKNKINIHLWGLSGILIFALLCLAPLQAEAQTTGFSRWIAEVKREARGKGLTAPGVETALSNARFLPRAIELDRKQPEGKMSFSTYHARVVNETRIKKGRALLRQHHELLESASQRFGVPAPYIVALWGIETSFGDNTGGFDVISALATLAYEGRRAEFFRDELFKALKILNDGHISADRMKGSWAGAMGQYQFMPSSFHAYAVDGNGDGHRDIWTSLPDVFSSTANYLQKSGWKADERWGRRVWLPNDFSSALTGLDTRKTLMEWNALGVRSESGEALPHASGMQASIVTPGGADGPAYMVYDNYRVIMKWNKSTYFATSVGLLADQIAR